jgi:acyl-CoA thioesterase-2
MASTVAEFVSLLTLEQCGPDTFCAPPLHTAIQHIFGGRVLAQALMASGRTVDPARSIHSLHAYFLRGGDPTEPIEFKVERLRDGRSFTTRRVVAIQHGKQIFLMTSSFHVEEQGIDHQVPMPQGFPPDGLPPWRGLPGTGSLPEREWAALDLRVDESQGLQVWLRSTGPMPADPLMHAATLAFASDLTLLAPAVLPSLKAPNPPRLAIASLDHAMWFHRPVHIDGWVRHDQHSPSSAAGRGFCIGSVFDADGRLVATTVQEGLIRASPDG